MDLNDIDEFVGFTPMDKALTRTMYGHNITRTKLPIMNVDSGIHTYVFFTRPSLNLRSFNLANSRILHTLLNTEDNSPQRAVRCLLDPLLGKPYAGNIPGNLTDMYKESLTTELIDNSNPFLSVLSNTLESLTGFTDKVLGRKVAGDDLLKGTYEQVDDTEVLNNNISLTATFNTMRGDVNRHLLYIWYMYQSLLYQGKVLQYPHLEAGNVIDYNTRIYIFNVGSDDTSIISHASPGPAIVTNVNYGDRFNFNFDSDYIEQHKTFSVEFLCKGVEYDEYPILTDFNSTVAMFNNNMTSGAAMKRGMIEPPRELRYLFNTRLIPYVDIMEYKLKWVVDKDYYNAKMKILKANGILDNLPTAQS